MTETDPTKDIPGEYAKLAGILRAADYSGESRVRNSLKNRLLNQAAPAARRAAFRGWRFPAAAAALAAIALLFIIPHKKTQPPVSYAAYETPTDAYSVCGRQGLKDYLPRPAF